MSAKSLYVPIVSCPLNCHGIVRDAHTNIPRGFFTRAKEGGPIRLLVVALNPGQPWGEQLNAYAELTDMQKVQRQLQLVDDAMHGPQRRTFHVRLILWLSKVLNVPEPEVFDHTIYSNIVKCTTPGNETPNRSMALTCANRHLVREIAFWKPEVTVGLGVPACRYLSDIGVAHESLPHPSNRESREYNAAAVERLRVKLNVTLREIKH